MHIHYLSAIRAQNPLIHNITSAVAANFSANGLLALGASPLMAESPAEAAELAARSAALVLNIGTPSQTRLEAMQQAGAAANRAGVPVILDPVAVGELLQYLALGAGAHGGGQQAHAHTAGLLASRGSSSGRNLGRTVG
nr:hydroxyethylthiazole kinase [uncultured Cardiobacterium sp.]